MMKKTLLLLLSTLILGSGCDKTASDIQPNADKTTAALSPVQLKGRVVNPKDPSSILNANGLSISLLKDGQLIAKVDAPDGQFEFTNLEAGHDYSLVPGIVGTSCGAVTGMDMLMLKKHLEGTQPINIFSQIAADVTKDSKLDQADLDRYQKIINGDSDLMKESCTSLRFYNLSASNPLQNGQIDQIVFNQLNTSMNNIQIGFIHPCDLNKYSQ